jgi:beta-lactamase class A
MTRLFQLPFLILIVLVIHGFAEQKTDSSTKVESHDYKAAYARIDSIARSAPGRIGVGVIDLATGDSFSYNGEQRFPMFSTYKFPLALYVLHQVGKGALSLQQEITITGKELDSYNHGKFVEIHHSGDTRVSVDSMIYYAMSYSDNITTDHLFKLVGGPAEVNKFIHALGVTDISIANTVIEMGTQNLYSDNWCTPIAMTRLLQLFKEGKVVSDEKRAYLLKYMEDAPSGAKRIKGLLPEGTVVAHKTGTGGTNDEGITAGTNDVGIINLPDGRQLILSVYISDFKGYIPSAEALIAQISKVVYEEALN